MAEEFNEMTQRDKVGAGFRDGPFFKNPIEHPAMTITEGLPVEVREKLQADGFPQPTPTDTWYERFTMKK